MHSSSDLQPGDVVAGLAPDEHVQIRSVKPFAGKVLIEGVGLTSRREIKRPFDAADLAGLVKIRGESHSFDGDAKAFLLGVEARRIRTAYQFDPLFAVNSSVVDVLPHQVEAVYRFLLPLPRIRFLLADDTGAGKTIMTGLLLKELLFRGVISKMLIITPGGLTKQWQEELREKFGLDAVVVNRAIFDAQPSQFAKDEGLFITSIDFISRHEGCLNAAREAQWDMIVVDEAHKLSAYEYGDKVDKAARYSALEVLAPRTDHLLFLTATPHRGRKDTFRRLMMLLDADLFQKDEFVTDQVQTKRRAKKEAEAGAAARDEAELGRARNRFFLRRLKEEMLDWNEQPLFKPRYTKTTGYQLTPEELELYEAVTGYVRSRRQEAQEKKNRNVELTLLVMQRRLASSINAITRTLENRLASLDKVLEILRDPKLTIGVKQRLLRGESDEEMPSTIEQYEDLDESQRAAVDKRIFGQVLSSDPEAIQKERDEVQCLVAMAVALRHHPEAKFAELLHLLDESDVMRAEDEKLLIFTEHRDTLDSLKERLVRKGYSVVTIDGSMGPDARKEAQRQFFGRAKIMIATDAAGEGINLQFCRYLINWDIPWNPNRLEQRMGRIHRYGQDEDVWVYNLVATNTREGKVLERVLSKLDVMREQMGTDRVYDVIDELLEDVPLVKLIERSIDAENEAEAVEEATRQVASPQMNERARELIELQKKQSLASGLDMRAARDLRDASDEHRLQPVFVQHFFEKAWREAGGVLSEDRDYPIFHLGVTPEPIQDAARRLRLPVSPRYDTPFVFDKYLVSVASQVRVPEGTKMLGPGHPLFNAVIEWATLAARDAFARGAIVVDPNIAAPQRIWLLRSAVEDGRLEEKKRLAHEELSVLSLDHLGLRATSPANLLNYTSPEGPQPAPDAPHKPEDEIQMWAYENLSEKQLARVGEARRAECDLRREYLEQAFTGLILDLQEKLNTSEQRQLMGDDDPEERRKLHKHLQDLKARKASRLAELDLMLDLHAELPEIITTALVVPAAIATIEDDEAPAHGVAMRRDDEVERIAMDVAMRYERARGWTPYDVSADGEHYDVRSESPAGEKRYIEVKGRAQSGAVMLTGPEVDKLRQLKDLAWLYIVTSCKGERPRLRLIQNPMAHLSPHELFKQVQFLVDERDWKGHAQDVDSSEEIS